MSRPAAWSLEGVVAAARGAAAARRHSPAGRTLADRAARVVPRGDAFARVLREGPGPRVVAECKRRSPSAGPLREPYDPAALARAYGMAGAAAISVLTERRFFAGRPDHLHAVRAAVSLPLLRKDFVIDELQVLEARAWGADAVLLIVAALDDRALAALLARVDAEGMEALVEVHDERELDRALAAGARIVGVNCRNLRTLESRPEVHARLAPRLPASITAVAESGVRTADDLRRLEELGYAAALVGEQLVAAPDPGTALAELLGRGSGSDA